MPATQPGRQSGRQSQQHQPTTVTTNPGNCNCNDPPHCCSLMGLPTAQPFVRWLVGWLAGHTKQQNSKKKQRIEERRKNKLWKSQSLWQEIKKAESTINSWHSLSCGEKIVCFSCFYTFAALRAEHNISEFMPIFLVMHAYIETYFSNGYGSGMGNQRSRFFKKGEKTYKN